MKYSKYILFFTLLTCTLTMQSISLARAEQSPVGEESKAPCQYHISGEVCPSNAQCSSCPVQIFLIDLHGTLFDTDFPSAVITGIMHLPFIIPKALYYWFWKFPFHRQAILEAFAVPASCQIPRTETWKALEAVPGNIHLYLFSNVTPASLAILRTRYPKFFEKFKKFLIPRPENNWQSKLISEEIWKEVTSHATQIPIVLFDDIQENCDWAKKKGLQCHHVTGDMNCAKGIEETAQTR